SHESEVILKEGIKESELQWAPRNQGNRNGDVPKRIVPVETTANALVVQDGIGGCDWSFQAEEGPTDFALIVGSLFLNETLIYCQLCGI
ncbi:hypothetical protein Tco_0486105, partial [Tanacetum coccineum]